MTCHVAVCDVCGAEYGAPCEDLTVHSTTHQAAVELVHADTGWLITTDNHVICLTGDQAHQDALDALLPPPPPAETDGQMPLALDL
ncbi:hypothetical protein [Kitasatospora sp. NPDC092286]|uniref:hypothetical protein n=1 Tax=Kitasatospora sp. NPDC092286 TaxID=3364087 RepID=UPI00382810D5